MNLRQPLEALTAASRGSIAAMVVDEAGETVGWTRGGASEEDLNLTGAYLGLRLRRLGDSLLPAGAGRTSTLEHDRGPLRFHVRALANGYSLVLVQERPGLSGEARRAMRRAGTEIERQLFPEISDE